MPLISNNKQNSSLTNYCLLAQLEKKSLILASPVTGRKHQIRKHFSMIGHPIIGDDKFGIKENDYFFLHSFYLEFKDEREKIIKLFAPLPDYFKKKIFDMKINIEQIKNEIEKNIL